MICRPMGSPSELTPAGTDNAGFQQRLANIVNGTLIADETSRPSISGRRRAGGAETDRAAVVGSQQDIDHRRTSGHVLLEAPRRAAAAS